MMSPVRLPGDLPAEREISERMKAWLWAEHRAEIHIMPFAGAFWTRLSVAAYTTEDECRAVGPLIEEALKAEGRISVYDSEQVQSTITSVRAKLRNRRAIAATEIGGWLAVMEQTQTLERIIAGRLSVDMQGSLRFAEVVQAR